MILLLATLARAATCSFDSTGSVSFGAYDVFSGSPADGVGTVVYRCVGVGGGDTVTVDLSAGGSGSYAARELTSGADTLVYNLYTDAARTQVWGDGTGGTAHYGPVTPPEDSPVTLYAYARLPAGQDVGTGTYTDTVTVTILY